MDKAPAIGNTRRPQGLPGVSDCVRPGAIHIRRNDLGGHITADAPPTKGQSADFMNPQPPAPATAGDARDAFGAWPHRSILVVDDEPGMRNFLQSSLEGSCREVRTAA